jgi:hypothetical protein
MRMPAVRIALAAAVVGACPAPASAAAPCTRYAAREWVTVTPSFGSGPETVVDHAVATQDPDRIYVTNGAVVLASADGGCTWTESLTQLDVPVVGATPKVTHLAVAATDPDVVYAALATDAASRPAVLRTTDGGRTWSAADRGLEGVQGRPLQLVVAATRPDVAYLVVEGNRVAQGDTSAEIARSLWATANGGAAWEERRATPLLVGQRVGDVLVAGNESFEGVTVDPRNSDLVWLYGGFGLHVSTDGARTSGRIQDVPGAVGAVDAYRTVDVSRVTAFGSRAGQAWVSFDGGARFHQTVTPGIVRSAVTGRRHSEITVATDTRVLYQQSAAATPGEITPDGPSVRDLAVSFGTVPVFYARTTASLLRWTAPADPRLPGDRTPPPETIDPTQVVLPQLPPLPAASLLGPRYVEVPAGESATVPYTLDLPGVQRADVFFLVDNSDSMSQEIDGLRSALAGIVTDLVAANVDAYFGVARYNTYDTEPYFRVAPIGPPGRELAAALEQLSASGGGTQKSQLEAIYQSVTGAGGAGDAAPTTLNPGGAFFITPGQQAGFRAEAPVKLVLHITDEGFYEGAPSPAYEKVAAALRASGVRQLGLALDNGDVLPSTGPGPEVGLRRVAYDSGALAPEGGVDCDGDGGPDIQQGEALVCVMPSERSGEATLLANAIVNLVRSIPNRGSVELSVSGAPHATLNRTSFDVEFKRTVQRSVEVTYACPGVPEPTEFRYDVRATAGDAPLAATATTVRCTPRAAGPPPAARGVPPLAAAGAPAQQPPAGNGNTNPNVNPNTQSQPQAQAQAGAALEPEERVQLTAADVQVRDEDAAPAAEWLAMVGLVTSAAALLGSRSRAAPQVARR